MFQRLLMLLVLAGAMTSSMAQQDEEVAMYNAVIVGNQLSASQAADLEGAVAKNPEDLKSRMELLGYYSINQLKSAEAASNRTQHILWFIQNHPEAPILGSPEGALNLDIQFKAYQPAKKLWLDQVKAHAQNPKIIHNAAKFFFFYDRTQAEDLLLQGQKLDPANPQWWDDLGQLHSFAPGPAAAAKSLAFYEKAQAIDASKEGRFDRLDNLSMLAFEAGDLKKASNYSHEMLDTAPQFEKAGTMEMPSIMVIAYWDGSPFSRVIQKRRFIISWNLARPKAPRSWIHLGRTCVSQEICWLKERRMPSSNILGCAGTFGKWGEINWMNGPGK